MPSSPAAGGEAGPEHREPTVLSASPFSKSPPLAPFPQQARKEQMGTVSSSLGLQMRSWGTAREEGSWKGQSSWPGLV